MYSINISSNVGGFSFELRSTMCKDFHVRTHIRTRIKINVAGESFLSTVKSNCIVLGSFDSLAGHLVTLNRVEPLKKSFKITANYF